MIGMHEGCYMKGACSCGGTVLVTATPGFFFFSEKAQDQVEPVSAGPPGGGQVHNVTGPLSSWVAFPDSNLGLYLSVHLPDKPGEWKQTCFP
jgi:hypothetical protein